MRSPLAERDRDRLIEAILPNVAFDGWSAAALRAAARQLAMPADEARALFPRGAPDLVAGFSRWADRRMLDWYEAAPPEAGGTAARIKRALELRFEVVAPWREAVRRALSVLAMPPHAALGAAAGLRDGRRHLVCGGRYWRPISASIQSARLWPASMAPPLFYWLEDRSDDLAETAAFIDRRLADVARLGEARERFETVLNRLPNPFRLLRPVR